MLDSESIHAELYTRDSTDRWTLCETRDVNTMLDLSSIGCHVSLAEVYAGGEV